MGSDATGFEEHNRYRMRYRARLSLKKEINGWATFGMRLASGTDSGDHRSTSRTLGDDENWDGGYCGQ